MTVGLLLSEQVLLRASDRFSEFFARCRLERLLFRENSREVDDVRGSSKHSSHYEACALSSAFLPVRCPFPELTPLNAAISLPRPVGFGFAPKLNFTVSKYRLFAPANRGSPSAHNR